MILNNEVLLSIEMSVTFHTYPEFIHIGILPMHFTNLSFSDHIIQLFHQIVPVQILTNGALIIN